MPNISQWFFATVFFIAILGFLVSGLLFFLSKTYSFSSKTLAGFLTSISIVLVNYSLMTSKFFLHFPHLWRVLAWASFCVGPMAFIYVRSVVEQSIRFRRSDLFFFIPAALYMLSLVPFFVLPASEKLAYIKIMIQNHQLIAQEPEGLLPQGWAVLFRVFYGFGCTIGQFYLLKKYTKSIFRPGKAQEHNVRMYKWMFLFSLVVVVMYIVLIVEFFFHLSSISDLTKIILLTLAGTILFISFYLLGSPELLYGLTGWLQTETPSTNSDASVKETDPEAPRRHQLTLQQGQEYKEVVETHFQNNLPFLQTGYTIGMLAQQVDIPSHQLSAFINQEYGKNFNELVNDFRIAHLQKLVADSDDYRQYTLEALGKRVGFNSRASFIAAVKKKTGKTPSEIFGRRTEELA